MLLFFLIYNEELRVLQVLDCWLNKVQSEYINLCSGYLFIYFILLLLFFFTDNKQLTKLKIKAVNLG